MADYETTPIMTVGDGGARRGYDRPPQRPPEEAKTAPRLFEDAVTLLGMPEGELPVPVQAALAALIAETERLRDELDKAKGHIAFLESEADHHPFLPVLNRRAFLRALARLIEQSERSELPGSLLYLHVGGIERLRLRCGLLAGDAALAQLVATIRTELRQTDLLGHLDGGDFAIALAVADQAGARDKAETIAARLLERPIEIDGERVSITLGKALVPFNNGVAAETLLKQADLLRRLPPERVAIA